MRIQRQPLHCLKCHHGWIGELVVDAPAKVFCASIEALHCPNCHSGSESVAVGLGAGFPTDDLAAAVPA